MTYPLARAGAGILLCALALVYLPAQAQQSKNLAPGFSQRPAASKLVVVPADLELFSIGAGGVPEPRADWTQAAQKNVKSGLASHKLKLGADVLGLEEKDMDELADINSLHGAVAQSVFLHHMMGGVLKLPTKNGALNWSLGEAVKPLKDKTGADYALFIWIRDSYASNERKAAMIAMAMLGVGIAGGAQIGYASLVDLNDGRIVWFNDLRRASGDLREAEPAKETVEALLKGFPVSQ
ncbi:hypothetical protein ACEN8I_16945 [Polaromonas sp. CT11-55]|uniref:hypothetical protein n=1 Tax=Polaromonas sp. CT11-55 TaxID=3243045 RepID=UPI0039A5CC7B